jgi:hypothetical protein
MLNGSLLELGGLAAAGCGIYQVKKLRELEREITKQWHEESVELAKTHHLLEVKTAKQAYLLELFNSLDQHFQQLNTDLISSIRESERDMFDQRNASCKSIILSSSVMLIALESMYVNVNLPSELSSLVVIAFSSTTALSFGLLFLSVVFCIELMIRTSTFMYKRGRSHSRALKHAIIDTKEMMKDLRHEGSKYESNYALRRDGLEDLEEGKSEAIRNGENEYKEMKRLHRIISRMNSGEIEKEFERHEEEVRNYLKKRELLNDASAIGSYHDQHNGYKRPFKFFWEYSCEPWWNMALVLFYTGSFNLVLAISLFMWAHFFVYQHSLLAAILGITILTTGAAVGFATLNVMHHADRLMIRKEALDMNRSTPASLAPKGHVNPAYLHHSSSISLPAFFKKA